MRKRRSRFFVVAFAVYHNRVLFLAELRAPFPYLLDEGARCIVAAGVDIARLEVGFDLDRGAKRRNDDYVFRRQFIIADKLLSRGGP